VALEAATEHATEQRDKAKVWYDRRAINRVFSPTYNYGEKATTYFPASQDRKTDSSPPSNSDWCAIAGKK